MIRRLLPLLAAAVLMALALARGATPPRRTDALGAMGQGPTVVLVHGLGSSASDWLPLARDLARDHRVVFVELPGHGLAAMPRTLTVDDAAQALDRALAEQSDGPVLLVGHSVGGLVAAAEALHAPARVRALVLVETALRPQLAPADRDSLLSQLARDWSGTLHAAYMSFGRDSSQGERLAREAATVDRATLEPWIRLALGADLSSAVARLQPPMLAVLAPHSWEADESWAAVATALGYARVPHVQGIRLENCGHFVMLDQPAALAAALRRFERDSATPVVASR